MAIFLLMTGFAFFIPAGDARTAVVSLGIYLFAMSYSPGEGPVPFTVCNDVSVSMVTILTCLL